MRETIEIIKAYKATVAGNRKCVLATVVHVEGSSYRRPSARMLVDEKGFMTGAISGGCLEGDALRKALHALVQNRNMLITYDTSDEEDAIVGAQLGCNGVIQVLFEPIDSADVENPIALLEKAEESREKTILISFFNLEEKRGEQRGTSLLIKDQKLVLGELENEKMLARIFKDALIVLDQRASLFREYVYESTKQNVFIEYFAPPISLVIVGAGNDTQVLAQMAQLLGWNITVVDGRPTHAKAERFVSSCQILVSKPEAILENLIIDDQTAFVLVTHNYNYDLSVLKCLLDEEEVPYIGILGPKKKFFRMLEDLKGEGIPLSNDQLDRIYAPMGLEIGAETPEEISLSVLSEVQAVLSKKTGTFLRDKKTPIHSKHNTQFDSVKI